MPGLTGQPYLPIWTFCVFLPNIQFLQSSGVFSYDAVGSDVNHIENACGVFKPARALKPKSPPFVLKVSLLGKRILNTFPCAIVMMVSPDTWLQLSAQGDAEKSAVTEFTQPGM